MTGVVTGISGNLFRIVLPEPIPAGSPVRLATADLLLLGEVAGCEATENGYSVVLTVSHSLSSLAELERLNQSLLGTDRSRDREPVSIEAGPNRRR